MELRYTDEGGAGELPVLFLHPYPYHRGIWEGQRDALRGKARFLSLDFRGLGEAELERGYMLEHLVDDVLALLDARGIEQALLCGCSMGGYVALRTVERAPERVRGLILVDTQAVSDSDEAKLARAAALRLLSSEGTSAFARAQLQKQLSPRTWSQRPDLVAQLQGMIEQSSPQGIAAAMVALASRTDVRPSLAKVRVPTRLIVGEDDSITTPTTMRTLQDAIPGADLHVLEGAGHLPSFEAASAFDRLLLEQVARLR